MKKAVKRSKTGMILIFTIAALAVIAAAVMFLTPIKDSLSVRIGLLRLAGKYSDYKMTDIHNHDSGHYRRMISKWKRWDFSRVVLFGSISSPEAVASDREAWEAYLQNPDIIIPYFSGFDLHDESCLEAVRDNFELGYFGIGETVAASTYSRYTANLEWKAEHPMDGYLPEIYELCAEYHAPILLHIDPPYGKPVEMLEEALDTYPDTIFIFAHINAYTSPEFAAGLMRRHDNLYIDFFAGFTLHNPESQYTLEDFVPVAREFPDRFMLSTDSGADIKSEAAAAEAMYLFIDLLADGELARKVAFGNYDAILQAQPATGSQLERLAEAGVEVDGVISKIDAGKLLAEAGD